MQEGHRPHFGKHAESTREQVKLRDGQEVSTAGFLKHADMRNATEDVPVSQEAYK